MAVLTKEQILKKIKEGELSFTPKLDKFQVKAHSIDLRMGFTFLIPKHWHMTRRGREPLSIDYYDPALPAGRQGTKNNHYEVVELEQGQYFDILPQEHVIISTLESIKMPANVMAILFPRSSVNRRGLSVELSGIIDAGYEGQLIIPVTNNIRQTIRLYPGERFCQVIFEELAAPTKNMPSRFHKQDVIKGFMTEKSSSERNLIRKGDIKKLKSRYGF